MSASMMSDPDWLYVTRDSSEEMLYCPGGAPLQSHYNFADGVQNVGTFSIQGLELVQSFRIVNPVTECVSLLDPHAT